jgi:hypothetical protein
LCENPSDMKKYPCLVQWEFCEQLTLTTSISHQSRVVYFYKRREHQKRTNKRKRPDSTM